jgi:hypothetical protein
MQAPRFARIPLVLACLALTAADVAAAGPAYVPYNEAHPVLAYYYGWWEPERLVAGVHQPAQMPAPGAAHVMDDVGLVTRHVVEAQDAGIDGFIVSQDSDFERLLSLVAGSDFRVSLHVGSGPATVETFYRHLDDPNLVRYEGRPVLFFWQTARSGQATWSDLRGRLDPQRRALWLADGDDFSVLRGDAFDGISPYTTAWSADPGATLSSWAGRARAAAPDKLFVPPVSPGCDDRPARAATCIQDRAGGAYYQRSLAGALGVHPDWAVVVSTWNEWLEDTQIEPSLQEGNLDLDLTRAFAGAFKQGNASAFGGVDSTPDAP